MPKQVLKIQGIKRENIYFFINAWRKTKQFASSEMCESVKAKKNKIKNEIEENFNVSLQLMKRNNVK